MANFPKEKEPTMSEILNKEMSNQPEKNIFDLLDQDKEINESKAPPVNPKYVINRKNLVKLIDITETHDSKIEMVCCKAMDLEDNQASMQKELARMASILKKYETNIAVNEPLFDKFFTFFSKDIHWPSLTIFEPFFDKIENTMLGF